MYKRFNIYVFPETPQRKENSQIRGKCLQKMHVVGSGPTGSLLTILILTEVLSSAIRS